MKGISAGSEVCSGLRRLSLPVVLLLLFLPFAGYYSTFTSVTSALFLSNVAHSDTRYPLYPNLVIFFQFKWFSTFVANDWFMYVLVTLNGKLNFYIHEILTLIKEKLGKITQQCFWFFSLQFQTFFNAKLLVKACLLAILVEIVVFSVLQSV